MLMVVAVFSLTRPVEMFESAVKYALDTQSLLRDPNKDYKYQIQSGKQKLTKALHYDPSEDYQYSQGQGVLLTRCQIQ